MTDHVRHHERLRGRGDGDGRVSSMELFFDLVYVFAVTQLSHTLLEHLTIKGALRTLLLLVAVWIVWIYTTWFTNWFDPDQRLVRGVLIAVMVGSLVMSATIPEAFDSRGKIFAIAFVAMQIGRSLFIIISTREQPGLRRNFQRIICWMVVSGALWIAGGFAADSTRVTLWIAALAIDYVAPVCGFYTPGMGRSTTHDWTIAGGHMAERCQLFLIVALGESILVTGGTFSNLEWTTDVVAAFVAAFLGSVALWWVYFGAHAEVAAELIEQSDDPGRLGRSAYTYFHLPMVAGVIVAAVGDELAIAHPTGHADTATIATILGGPALFLAGHALFKWSTMNRISVPRLVAIAALGLVSLIGSDASPLFYAIVSTLIVGGVVAIDIWMVHRGYHASPLATRG